MTDTPSPLPDLRRAYDSLRRLVEDVQADQWTLPTPCDDWDVRALVNHLVMGNLMFTAIVQRSTPPDRTADHLGDDPVGSFTSSGEGLIAAVSQPGVFEETYTTPFGEWSGRAVVHMRINEFVIHGWDVARATGQDAALPEDLAESALTMWRGRITDVPRDALPFGEAQPAPDDAPASDRLAAFLGREP